MNSDLLYLFLLEEKTWNKTPIQQDEYDKVFAILNRTSDNEVVVLAGLILVNHRPSLLHLIEQFPNFGRAKQQNLYLTLATSGFMEAYKLLFRLLRFSKNKEDIIQLTVCLAKTDYFIFPLLIMELNDYQDKPEYIEKLKDVVARMGFSKLKPYLKSFPIIPSEWVFRAVFGNDVINLLYKDMEDKQLELKKRRLKKLQNPSAEYKN